MLDLNTFVEKLAPTLKFDPSFDRSFLENYCNALFAMLKAGTFSHPFVTGLCPAGSPLLNGAATNGIAILTPAAFNAGTSAKFPPESQASLTKEHSAVTTYLSTRSIDFVGLGNITGICTSGPTTPGVLVNGAGRGGQMTGLSGTDLTQFVKAQLGGDLPLAEAFYTALCEELGRNLICTYLPGSVNGSCLAGFSPLVGGFATGGRFS